MSWVLVSRAVADLLAAARPDIRVQVGDRMLRTTGDVGRLFGVPAGDGTAEMGTDIRAAIVAREAVIESSWSQLRTIALDSYAVRVLVGFQDARDTDAKARALVDDLAATIRETKRVTGCDRIGGLTVEGPEIRMVGDHPCHVAEIEFEAEATHTRSTTGRPAGATDDPTETRGIAEQIAAALAETGVVRAHPRRRFPLVDADVIELYSLTPDAALGAQREIRAWQVWSPGWDEDRGLGLRTGSSGAFHTELLWGWRDTIDSYSRFQVELDAARARLRAAGWIGHPGSGTRGRMEPLVIEEIGGRYAAGHACHYARGTVGVSVLTHA